MKILFTASECVPFVKTGGLADVVGALAPVLAKQGHDVRVILPLFGSIPETYTSRMSHVLDFEVQLGWRKQYCGIEKLEQDGVTWYFVDNKYYFGRPYIYGMGGDEYERFGFFCRGILNALPMLDWQPDVSHAPDWQSGMVPALLKIQYAHLPFFAQIKTVFTIHNLQYQGVFGIREVQEALGLSDDVWTDDKLECYGCANYLKAGLVYSDVITTVSPSYSEEIQTAYYGERLDGLLRARKSDLFGVLNGIDMVDYDPAIDNRIEANYSADDMAGKAECKRALQEKLGLEVNPDVPIIGMVGRLSNQKGLDLVDFIISDLLNQNVQLVVLGMGESRYVNLFSWAESAYPGKVAVRFAMDHALAHQIYAGSDMFLMPSQFEPCGLSQLISLRYGTVPIVRETGGLRDTVLSYNEYTGDGNGFSFFNYNAHDMLNTINRAIRFYHNDKEVWHKLMYRGMSGDYSWTNSAGKYVELYRAVLGNDFVATAVEEAPEADAESNKATTEENVQAPETTPAAEVVEEKPAEPVKKPRKPRTKKTVDAAAPAEEKPARKPRAKKVKEEAAPAEGEEAPVKKTRTRKAKTEAEVGENAEALVKKPRAPRKKKVEEPTEPKAE